MTINHPRIRRRSALRLKYAYRALAESRSSPTSSRGRFRAADGDPSQSGTSAVRSTSQLARTASSPRPPLYVHP